MGNLLGAYLLAEGWAEPVDDFRPAMIIPRDELAPDMDPTLPPIPLDRRRRHI